MDLGSFKNSNSNGYAKIGDTQEVGQVAETEQHRPMGQLVLAGIKEAGMSVFFTGCKACLRLIALM